MTTTMVMTCTSNTDLLTRFNAVLALAQMAPTLAVKPNRATMIKLTPVNASRVFAHAYAPPALRAEPPVLTKITIEKTNRMTSMARPAHKNVENCCCLDGAMALCWIRFLDDWGSCWPSSVAMLCYTMAGTGVAGFNGTRSRCQFCLWAVSY